MRGEGDGRAGAGGAGGWRSRSTHSIEVTHLRLRESRAHHQLRPEGRLRKRKRKGRREFPATFSAANLFLRVREESRKRKSCCSSSSAGRIRSSPLLRGVTQHVIPSVLAPSYDADRKSLDES